MFGFLRPARADYLSDWIDWIEAVDDEVIFTQTGGLLRLAMFDPPDLETAAREDRGGLIDRFTELLTVPGTGWSLWIDKWHLEDRGYLPASDFGGNKAALLVDNARRAQFADTAHAVFTDRHILAMHWAPQQRDAILAVIHDRDARSARETLRAFRDQTDELLRGMSLLCPSVRVLAGHGLGTALALPITYSLVPTPLPRHFVAQQLGSLAEWHTGMEMAVDGLNVAAVEVHAFGSLTPETVEVLHELPYPYRWTNVLHCLDPDHQRSAIQWDRKRWEPKQFSLPGWLAVAVARDRSFGRERPDVAVAMAELDELESGMHAEKDGLAISSMTIRVWDEDLNALHDRAQDIVSKLNAGDMRSRVSTFPALGAVADIYGNASKDVTNRRRPKVHISKMAKCSPLTGLTAGHREDLHLKGPALLVAHSRRRGPLFWPLHAPGSDVGHTAVIGPTGAGKSALLSFMALQYLRYESSTVTIFDKRCSAMVATLCAGGDWLELGSGGIGVQPLRHLDTPEDMAWASSWLQEALRMRNVPVHSRVDTALNEALQAVRELPADERTLSALCAHMGGDEGARSALATYTATRPIKRLMDGVVPGYGKARVLCFETSPIERLVELPLVMAACTKQIERERLGGDHPKLFLKDEAWVYLKHPFFLPWIEDLARTGRKLKLALCLFTQSVRDLEGEATGVIMEQMAQAIYTPNSKALDTANARLYADRGLSDEQIGMLASMRPKGEYMLRTDSWTRCASIELAGDALRICGASRPADIARARALLAEGVEPGEEFTRRWLSS